MLRLRKAKQAADYPPGTCTRHVYDVVPWVPRGWGDAWQWGSSARAAGYAVTFYPLPGAVAVWDPGTQFGVYGHVALVVENRPGEEFTVQDASGVHMLHADRSLYHGPLPTDFIQAPPTPHRRGADGAAGAGRGAAPNPIVEVVSAWDGVAWYWNHTAPLQAIRGGVITGMLAGLY
jgi:surface antigen